MIYPILLAGGSGTRLWPLSRKSYPKQFAPLMGETSLYQATLKRFSGSGFAPPVVLTNTEFRFVVTEQLSDAGFEEARILIEPVARNTAPAILAAALLLEEEPDALMLVAPCDHVIADEAAFAAALEAGAEAARAGRLVTFGITPDRAETGYGYLELEAPLSGAGAQPLRGFVEKPDKARASKMKKSGQHMWNAGIFLFKVSDILTAFQTHAPDLVAPVRASLENGRPDLGFFRLEEDAFAGAADISIDYAVMERADNLSVVPYSGGWSDLGTWEAVWHESAQGAGGVATSGPVTAIDCENTLLRSETPHQHLVGLGLSNIAAVAMGDAVLVASLDQSQRVKEVVAELRAADIPQAVKFPRDYRPWGWFETLSLGPRFQVKRIMVKPGGQLSLQSHVHRAEHWVVVEGAAQVSVSGEERILSENQSVYIPLGAVHRLANPGKVDLHLIEVQSGPYLGEDDITRYDDIYARD